MVEPASSNLGSYGHEIRNLMLLACTEVETQCRGVLKANNYSKSVPTRADYRKLAEPMRLFGYEVSLSRFPDLPAIRPFAGWATGGTKLPWYDAYNAVKHNREVDFSLATLANAIDAVCGLIVIAYAQDGPKVIDLHLPAVFHVTLNPSWEPQHWYFVNSEHPNCHEELLQSGTYVFP